MYKLYWAPGTAALAPQAVLEEAGAAYEIVPVDLGAGEQHGDAYLALNPGGYVPTLVTGDGQVLTESAAIMLALCERYPEVGLLPPPDDPERGTLYRWLFYLTNGVQSAYKNYYYPRRYSTGEGDAPRIKARAREHLLSRWRVVEDQLAKPGPWLLGARYGAADLFMVMLSTWFDPRDELFAACPRVKRCLELAAERPAMHRALEAHGALP